MRTYCFLSVLVVAFSFSPLIAAADKDAKQGAGASHPQSPPTVVYLNKSLDWDLCAGGDEAHRKPLPREFFRQALLIAARDQLGLSTRDAWLGDPMPTGGNNAPFDLRTKYEPSTPVEILRGYPPAPPLVKRYELKLNGDLPYLAAEAEKLSRTKFVEALKEAGFSGKANPWTPEAKMPDHIEPLLCEMTFTSQFQALRELHEAIHCGGESPALLGGLVRGYANLGVLTEYLWHPEHKAFKARAWLYAERMVARDEHSALARWHRAYAMALIGMHKAALEDLDAADKEAKTAGAKGPLPPAWAPVLRAYCHYDIDRLAAEGPASAQGQLAGLLAYCSARLAQNGGVMQAKATELLPWMPGCYRLRHGQCISGDYQSRRRGAATASKVFAERLYGRLLAMPGLPAGAAAIAKQRPAAKGLLD